jgi:hypothetical protein
MGALVWMHQNVFDSGVQANPNKLFTNHQMAPVDSSGEDCPSFGSLDVFWQTTSSEKVSLPI